MHLKIGLLSSNFAPSNLEIYPHAGIMELSVYVWSTYVTTGNTPSQAISHHVQVLSFHIQLMTHYKYHTKGHFAGNDFCAYFADRL